MAFSQHWNLVPTPPTPTLGVSEQRLEGKAGYAGIAAPIAPSDTPTPQAFSIVSLPPLDGLYVGISYFGILASKGELVAVTRRIFMDILRAIINQDSLRELENMSQRLNGVPKPKSIEVQVN